MHKVSAFGDWFIPVKSLDFMLFFQTPDWQNQTNYSLPSPIKQFIVLTNLWKSCQVSLSVGLCSCCVGLCHAKAYTRFFILWVIASIISSHCCNVLFSPPLYKKLFYYLFNKSRMRKWKDNSGNTKGLDHTFIILYSAVRP